MGRECVVKNEGETPGHRVRERQNSDWVGREGLGRRAGKRPQGTAKGLTLTERRLSFAFTEGTPRPEGQAFRRPRGGPMEAALILRFLLIKEKEEKECSPLAV